MPYKDKEERKKASRMGRWRYRGVKNVTDELHDYFMKCVACEVCGKEFKNNLDRHLDHDHDTGDFRFVLCRWCNHLDNWKKETMINREDKFVCECGGKYIRKNKHQHFRTKKHQDFILNKKLI